MIFNSANHGQLVAAILLSLLLATHAQAIDQEVAWVGGGGNNLWSNANNWNPNAAPPCNFGPVEFLVTIPANAGTIVFDAPMGSCEIKSLTVGDNSTLVIASSASLAVLEEAMIFGIVDSNDNFTANDPQLVELAGNRARLRAHNGGIVALSADSYSATGLTGTFTLLSANGTGDGGVPSMISLPNLATLDDSFTASGTRVHTISATEMGQIDLSGIQSIIGPGSDERLEFVVNSGGSIDFSSLQTITGSSSGRTRLFVGGGSALSLPSLGEAEHLTFHVSDGGAIDAAGPEPLHYSASDLAFSATLLSAEGPGSLLNLSSMATLDDSFTASGTRVHTISATEMGQIDLSGIQSIIGPGSDERLEFVVNSGGSIDLSSLVETSTTSAASLRFILTSGGEVRSGAWTDYTGTLNATLNNVDAFGENPPTTLHILGDLAGSSQATITLQHANTELRVDGSILQGPSIDLRAPAGGEVLVGGRFCYTHGVEDDLELGDATLHLNGAGDHAFPQYLEVGGSDLDLLCNFSNDNFGVGSLVIGSADQPTVVHLRDGIDNGNSGGGNPEALYIYHEDGLRIHAGSTIVINELNVYLCAEQVRLKDLFPKGVDVIPYDEGYIEWGQYCGPADINCDGVVNVDDLLIVLNNWGPCADCADCIADIHCNCEVNVDDLLIILNNWG